MPYCWGVAGGGWLLQDRSQRAQRRAVARPAVSLVPCGHGRASHCPLRSAVFPHGEPHSQSLWGLVFKIYLHIWKTRTGKSDFCWVLLQWPGSGWAPWESPQLPWVWALGNSSQHPEGHVSPATPAPGSGVPPVPTLLFLAEAPSAAGWQAASLARR